MQRSCAHCGRQFQAQRGTAKYCGSSCRGQATKARTAGEVVDLSGLQLVGGIVASVESELRDAGVLDSPGGQHVVFLAARMEQASDASLAGMSKEFRTLKAEVLAGTEQADELDNARDAVVEFRRRRA